MSVEGCSKRTECVSWVGELSDIKGLYAIKSLSESLRDEQTASPSQALVDQLEADYMQCFTSAKRAIGNFCINCPLNQAGPASDTNVPLDR